MQYEEFVYEFIKLLMSWGVWKDSVKILYGGKCFSPCQMARRASDKCFDYEDCIRRYEKFQEDKEKTEYRKLKNVVVTDLNDEEKEFQTRWDKDCEMCVILNGPLNDLFAYGVLVTELSDLPLSKKLVAYQERKELQETFHEEYDEEEIRINPEEYGIPSALDFDSTDEYEAFFEVELERLESEFIANMSGKIEYNNDLEAEICNLCIEHGLSYEFTGDSLLIGHDYF